MKLLQLGTSVAQQEEARELDIEKTTLAAGLNDEERTSEYFLVRQQLERTRGEVSRVIQLPTHCLPYIQVQCVLQTEAYDILLRFPRVSCHCMNQRRMKSYHTCRVCDRPRVQRTRPCSSQMDLYSIRDMLARHSVHSCFVPCVGCAHVSLLLNKLTCARPAR